MLACQCPIIAEYVGVISTIPKNKPHLLYSDGDIEEFVNAVKLQLSAREMLEIDIPNWKTQANHLYRYMQSLITDE